MRFLPRDHLAIDEWSMRYVRALLDMAGEDAVRHKTAWMLEQRSRFPRGVQDAIFGYMYLAAQNVADNRAVMKLHEVEERRATLLGFAAADRAEAEAAAKLNYGTLELEAKAARFETLANSLYQEDDPAIVTYRSCDQDSDEGLARGILRTLVRTLTLSHTPPMTGIAAAAGSKVTPDKARLVN